MIWTRLTSGFVMLQALAFGAVAQTVMLNGDQALDTGEPPAIRFRDTDRTVERTGTDPRRFDFSDIKADTIDFGANRLHCAREQGEPESVVLDLGGASLAGTGSIALDMRLGDRENADSIALINAGDIAVGGIETSCETSGDAGAIEIGNAERPVGSVRIGFLHAAGVSTKAGRGGNIAVHGSGDVRIAAADGEPGDIRALGGRFHGGNVIVSHRGNLHVRHLHTYTRCDFGRSGWVGSIRLDGGNASGDAEIQGDVTFSAQLRNSRGPHSFEARNYRNVRIGGAIDGYSSHNRANDTVIADIAGDIDIAGRIDLERRTPGRLRSDEPENNGRLVLEAGGTVTLAELDLRLVSEALLSSGGGEGASVIRGELIGFDPAATGGTGTPADPFLASQTVLRAPEEARIHYDIAQSEHAGFAPFSYRVADPEGEPGKGGLLMPDPGVAAIAADEPRGDAAEKIFLPAMLISAGQSPASVSVFWGEGGDRGTDAEAWPHTHAWEPHTGPLPADYTHAVAPQPATRYTYRFAVRNAEGEMWTPPQSIARTARVFDMAAVGPARWLDGADAAVSFTWDDNLASQRDIATIFNEYDWRSTFVVNPGLQDTWEPLKADYAAMSREGHEIGNHTYRHGRLIRMSARRVASEVVQAAEAVEELTGIYPVSFVHPFNATNEEVDSVVFKHHLVARISSPYGMDGRVIHNDPGSLRGFRRDLDRVAEPGTADSGGWLIVGAHGMDGDGFRPIEEDQLRAILDHLKARPENLWVGAMGEVGIYESVFKTVTVDADYTYDTLTLRVTGFDAEKYARAPEVPFTVSVPLRAPLELSQVRLEPDDVSARMDDGRLLVTFDLKKTDAVTPSLR